MAKWNTTCIEFKQVRELIENDGDNNEILSLLAKICRKLTTVDEDFEYDFEDLADEIEIGIDDSDLDDEVVDYYLDEFYDLCDAARIWLGL